ncbi:MAG TPA: hypothetical protein GXX40_07260 [Firmicutes bacterium]|nr:hypothetical protein [Bacillota bacterium]
MTYAWQDFDREAVCSLVPGLSFKSLMKYRIPPTKNVVKIHVRRSTAREKPPGRNIDITQSPRAASMLAISI